MVTDRLESIDQHGSIDQQGSVAPEYVDLFEGFALRDAVSVLVESQVTVSAVNVVGAEYHEESQRDAMVFEISRGRFDTQGGLPVYFRLHVGDEQRPQATDPIVNPARGDYRVLHESGHLTGLAGDPYTLIGTAGIPHGSSATSITIVPQNDLAVEWDESIAIELIDWDEYRSLHDQITDPTPNAGFPSYYFLSRWWDNRAPYRLKQDLFGDSVEHVAAATILDNDDFDNRVVEKPDAETTDLAVDVVSSGLVQVDLYGGHARLALPVFAPSYSEDNNLLPVAEAILRLPDEETAISRLTGLFTVGGLPAREVDFDVSALPAYLAENPHRELRLVLIGPESLTQSLASGHYDSEIVITAQLGEMTATRTARGSVDVINRVDPQLGTSEFGERWWLDELDRLVPGDGVSARGTSTAASRLAELGGRTETGIALLRGDNSTTWFAAEHVEPSRIIEVDDADQQAVTFGDPALWVGQTGADGHAYRTTQAGVRAQRTYVDWTFDALEAGHLYQLYVQWDADPQLASNAVYQVFGADAVGNGTTTMQVDQRYQPGESTAAGRYWRSLGFFTPTAQDLSVRIRLATQMDAQTFVDGPLSAGAAMLVDSWDFAGPSDTASTLQVDVDPSSLLVTTKSHNRYRFDASTGLLRQLEDRNGNQTEYHYLDADGDTLRDELRKIVRQGGLETDFQYSNGRLSVITDFADRLTRWGIVDGQVWSVRLPDPGIAPDTPVFQFAYADDGLMDEVVDPELATTTIHRDPRAHRVTRIVNPDGQQWNLEPFLVDGAAGELRLPATGRIGAGQRELNGLVEPRATRIDTRGNSWLYQTGPHGLLTAETKPPVPGSPQTDTWRWIRDTRGLPLAFIVPPGGGGDTPLPSLRTEQVYDEFGDLVRRTFADGTFESWAYDETFRQVRYYRDALNRVVRYQLDDRGNVAERVELEGKYADTPDRKTRYQYSGAPDSILDLPGGLITAITVASDSLDAVTTVNEYYASGPHVGLLSAVHHAVGMADPEVATTERFAYDPQRNLAQRVDAPGAARSMCTTASIDCTNKSIRCRAPVITCSRSPPTTMMRSGMWWRSWIRAERGRNTSLICCVSRLPARCPPRVGTLRPTRRRPRRRTNTMAKAI